MTYDDWKSTEPDLGDRGHMPIEARRHCTYCERRERQVPWPPEAPTMWRCQVCGDTRAAREATASELSAAFAAVIKGRA